MVSKITGWSHPSIPPVERPWTVSVPWERSKGAFLCGGFISKWVQQALITGGFSHGQHGQCS